MTQYDELFSCQCCGECCRGDMRVYLNPDDLKRIAVFEGYKNTRQLFDDFLVVIDSERSSAPLPRLRFSKGSLGCCPYLENTLDEEPGFLLKGYCRLHPDFKPLVCMLAPMYRTIDLEEDSELWGFKTPLKDCPGCSVLTEEKSYYAPEGLSTLLDSEKTFFKKIAGMLDSGCTNNEVIETLYYFDVK
ncbi:MAG: YkgJ family cysteine cluster protein [Spirochaetales bacterium]|nr:YkgJ family cysteine cluster protein [Spirochaetales bacterium]